MLSVPLPGSGVPDADEMSKGSSRRLTRVDGREREGIYATRTVERSYGEGPVGHRLPGRADSSAARAMCEPYTSEDMRFTMKGDIALRLRHGLAGDQARRRSRALADNAPKYAGRHKSPRSLCSVPSKAARFGRANGLKTKMASTSNCQPRRPARAPSH